MSLWLFLVWELSISLTISLSVCVCVCAVLDYFIMNNNDLFLLISLFWNYYAKAVFAYLYFFSLIYVVSITGRFVQRVSNLHPFSQFGASSARIVPSVFKLQWPELSEICRCLLNRFFIILIHLYPPPPPPPVSKMLIRINQSNNMKLHSNIRNLIWMVSFLYLLKC